MSRIGRKPIEIPAGVEVTIEDNLVRVKGPKGELARSVPRAITVRQEEGRLLVERPSDAREHRALHGLVRTLVKNMVEGVSRGFTRSLELSGVGYRAAKQGEKLVLTVGYSRPVEIVPEPGLEIEVPAPNRVVVHGIDKEAVGNLAARIRGVRPPEPYKGKGIRYEGERLRHKVGKAGTGKKK
ncbi:MAG: 50S ribosomal protein L6 [Clostridia bacterium]|nr:50S ribosomal protein L6 [Clostridia bacterium]